MAKSNQHYQMEQETQNDSSEYDRIVNLIKDGYKVMVLMRGLPGSGKSYLAAKLMENSLGKVNKLEFIFSINDYFYRSGRFVYNCQDLSKAHDTNRRKCFEAVKYGVSPIIIDSTNLQIIDMQVYCAMAIKFGYVIEIIEANMPWAFNIKELVKRNTCRLNEQEIKSMLEHYERNLSPSHLLHQLNMTYMEVMPQFRNYPPLTNSKFRYDEGSDITDSLDNGSISESEINQKHEKQSKRNKKGAFKFQSFKKSLEGDINLKFEENRESINQMKLDLLTEMKAFTKLTQKDMNKKLNENEQIMTKVTKSNSEILSKQNDVSRKAIETKDLLTELKALTKSTQVDINKKFKENEVMISKVKEELLLEIRKILSQQDDINKKVQKNERLLSELTTFTKSTQGDINKKFVKNEVMMTNLLLGIETFKEDQRTTSSKQLATLMKFIQDYIHMKMQKNGDIIYDQMEYLLRVSRRILLRDITEKNEEIAYQCESSNLMIRQQLQHILIDKPVRSRRIPTVKEILFGLVFLFLVRYTIHHLCF